ncbi:uncharacterized protein LOC133193900 [Saccostrea echinata]|uniref:uncharacterized protein LOC133193900 n=1 Tax=Saccostrea echinata TaxID=191078 RepID=UPI002A80D3B7|nr:uncharacterized protein LOC133193900 [Saccostrea echinata]
MAFSILYWANYTAGTKKLSRKSEIAVHSDHVLRFIYDQEASYVRGVVQASMRDRSYNVTISLGTNYNVENSTCECVNGQDKCHHKASLLLYGYKNVSKTDVRQSWVKNPKSVPPRQTKTMEDLFPAADRFVNYRLASS